MLDHCDRHLSQAQVAIIVILSDRTVDKKSARVDWRLWDEPVRRRDTEEAREKRCQAEQRKIIVETSRLAEWELGALSNQRLRASPTTRSLVLRLKEK